MADLKYRWVHPVALIHSSPTSPKGRQCNNKPAARHKPEGHEGQRKKEINIMKKKFNGEFITHGTVLQISHQYLGNYNVLQQLLH